MSEDRAAYHVELVGGQFIDFEGDDKDLATMNAATPFVINADNQTLVPWTSILYIKKIVVKKGK